MKKFVSLCLVLIFVLSLATIGASAATKSDVLEAVKATKFAHYFAVDVENVLRTVDITEEQADKLIEIIKAIDAYFTVDKGDTIEDYTVEEYKFALAKVEEACAILGVTYETFPVAGVHVGNVKYVFKNANGETLYEYDGDLVNQTGGVAPENNTVVTVLCVLAGLALLGGAIVAFKKTAKA